ncbi:MAG: hypothetical protein AAGK80_01530 [Pseudomonadota bacterium]
MLNLITQTRVLWILFGLFVVETIGFGIIMRVWDFAIIDEMSDPDKISAHIGAMSETQRGVHAWMTATLDVAYPLTYGPLFAGLALRAFKPVFAFPAVAVIPTDLAEGYVQVMALIGDESLLWLKAYLTPLKLVWFLTAMVIAIAALLFGYWRRKHAMSAD